MLARALNLCPCPHTLPLWQVLMTTRTGNVRTRCLALEVLAHLVDRLREEYLVLLPEVRWPGAQPGRTGRQVTCVIEAAWPRPVGWT